MSTGGDRRPNIVLITTDDQEAQSLNPRVMPNVSRLLADRCVAGITANADRVRAIAESSPSIATPLNRHIGYEEAARVAKQALAEGKTIRQVVIERGYVRDGKLSEEELDRALDVMAMTRPAEHG